MLWLQMVTKQPNTIYPCILNTTEVGAKNQKKSLLSLIIICQTLYWRIVNKYGWRTICLRALSLAFWRNWFGEQHRGCLCKILKILMNYDKYFRNYSITVLFFLFDFQPPCSNSSPACLDHPQPPPDLDNIIKGNRLSMSVEIRDSWQGLTPLLIS